MAYLFSIFQKLYLEYVDQQFPYNHHYISREMSDVIDRLTASSLLPTIDHISHVSSQDWNSLTV